MSEKYDILIIGAGLSGLLSASLLSMRGYKVCILEKNAVIGGMIQPYKRNGVFLETGMNFFGAYKKGQIQNKLFSIFGISDDLSVTEIPNFEFITDKKKYLIPNNFELFKNKLISYFPNEKKGIEIFVKEIKKISESITVKNIYSSGIMHKYFSESALEFINSVTKNKELQNLLKFNGLLYGNDFSTLSLYIYAVITGSFLQSAGMFTNGTKHFIEILKENILKNGGVILTKKEVLKIKSFGNKISHCVCNDGTEFYADFFISTIHPQILIPKTESDLLKSFYRKRISELPNSSGAFIINVILKDKKILFDEKPKFINLNNKSILFYHSLSERKGKYSKVIKIMCEDEISEYKEWFAVKTGNRGDSYEQFKNKKAENIFVILEKIIPYFKSSVEKYYVSTPLTFRDYTGSKDGSAYGILKNFKKESESIIPINTKFKNLFLSGQSVNFHGLSGVSITSLLVCSAVMNIRITE